MPGLAVGLHLVLVEGQAVLPQPRIPDLVDASGQFPSGQLALGFRYFFQPGIRAQLRAEIAAQFQAFAATGLSLDHADAHKHMHLHPTVGRLMIEACLAHGLRALRVPAEPVSVMAQLGASPTPGARAMQLWSRVLRHQARRAGLATTDQVFGLAWSGGMTEARVLQLAELLPPGVSEIYFHPAHGTDPLLQRLMPGYDHQAELDALCSPRVRAAFSDVDQLAYGDL